MNPELLQKYIAGDATSQEKESVMRWVNESPENMRQYMAMRKLNDISIWRTPPQTNIHVTETKPISRRLWTEVMKIAAVAALVFAASHFFLSTRQTLSDSGTLQSIYVPAGQRVELLLADSTKVWLNSRSTLSFPKTFDKDNRIVRLDGEGYFAVTPDSKRPFIVETSKYDIKVLGTEFNVIAYAENDYWETALLEGSVEIYVPDSNIGSIRLEPNSQLSLRDTKLSKNPISRFDYFLWREGLICFNDLSISEIFEKIQMYYDVDIIVNNTNILKNRYTGKFRASDGVEHVIKVLRLNTRFSYTKNDETNTIIIN